MYLTLQLEKRFANPRDIEFAVDSSNVIHLLQVTIHHISLYIHYSIDSSLHETEENFLY